MGESCDLEEGEMNCSSNEDVVDLSYIEKRVQNVLGHLQKDFGEGAMGLFGPKICDYGSFLPTYKRPLAVPPCQRIPLGNHAVQRFSNNLPGKNVVQKFQSVPTTTSSKLVSQQNPQNYQTSGSLLAQAPEKVPIKKVNARIPGNDLSGLKPIRFRIKMGSEILSRKVTMVCNDLGFDDSPTSPPQNSHDDSSRKLPHTSLEETSESPSCILREMTAIPVPEHLLLSPLPDSLLLMKDKEKQYSLVDNEPVLKARKEPSIQTQNKFQNVLGCGETPNGRRRKAVDCFDDNTWNETSSFNDMKKQKVFSTGQRARENSTCGLVGTSSTKDGFTAKTNLQKDIKNDGETYPRVPFAKSNKMRVVGKQAEKEKKTYPTKLKQNSSKYCIGDKFLSKMPSKDAAYIGQNNLDIGPDLDNWVECDSCETWRLLPFGLKPDQLPDKWLCSMQTWLPGMNHCGVSEEETTNAIKSSHGPEAGGKLHSAASNADKSSQPLTSGSLPKPIEKKSSMKNLSQVVSSDILVDAAKPMRSNSHIFKIKMPRETPNATQISTDLGVSHNILQDKIDQKAKWRSAGTGSQIKIKKEKEGVKQESEGDKQIKTGDGNKLSRDIKAEEIHWKQDLEWTPEERKTKRQDNDYTSDVERVRKKRLLASKKKSDHKHQLTTGSGSFCTEADGRIDSPVTVGNMRRMGFKKVGNGNNSKLFTDGEAKEPSMDKAATTKISVQEIKVGQRNELFQADGLQAHRNADTSSRYLSGGSGQISGVETSSSLKVLGSHKSGRYVEEVKASPVESVSSSPARYTCPKNLASAGVSIPWKNQDLKLGDAGSRNVNNRKHLSPEADNEVFSTIHPINTKQPKPEVCEQNSKFDDLPRPSMKSVLEIRAGIKSFGAITHATMDSSCQAVTDILQEAEKLRKLADCFKRSGFDYEHKETNLKAALMFLLGASLLEMRSTENVEGGKMSHVEAYHTAAKLSENCGRQYETSQEMAAAALAYKCTEVACMRIVYGKTLGLSGEWNELQKHVQITPRGESPSSSASDVESFSHQGMIDKSKRDLSHIAGNLLPVARNQQNFAPLLDFTENMNLAMEASAKSQNAFRAASGTSEGDCLSAIKKVVDFSFHDVEALIQMIELAMDVLSSSKV